MARKYTKQYLDTLDKKDLITIIYQMDQEIIDLELTLQHKDNLYNELKNKKYEIVDTLVHNTVSDKEYAVVMALRNMMNVQADNAIELHEDNCHFLYKNYNNSNKY